jgi:PEP-CTERM motif-containing protein
MRKLRLLASAIPCGSSVALSLAGLLLLGSTQAAQAVSSPVTFAQFKESTSGSNTNQFAYIDNGPSGDAQFGTDVGGVLGAPVPATFSYLSIVSLLPADLQGVQDATVSLTTSTIDPVTTAFNGMLGVQTFDGSGTVVDVLKITRTTPAAEGNGTNLLTMTFTDDLLGVLGGRTPQLSGNAPPDTVTYSSDFINFNNSGEQNYSLTFSSWASTGDGGGLELSPTAGDNFFASATAAGTGTFDGQVSIPEPASGTLALIGLGALARFRRSRTAR